MGIVSHVRSCLDSVMLINAFLHNYTHLFLSGVNFSNRRHISPATVTNWLLYILIFTSTYLVTSHNSFVELFCKTTNVCISIVRMVILTDDGVTERPNQVTSMQCNMLTI